MDPDTNETKDVYRKLCETLAKRGGKLAARDIPEFYELARELFTEEEAAVTNAMPRGFNPASVIAAEMGKSEEEVTPILEAMANKGLCIAVQSKGVCVYRGFPIMPGLLEYQFYRGTKTEKDRKLARLFRAYEEALRAVQDPYQVRFPEQRVLPVNQVINAQTGVHTYHQVASYIEQYDPLSVGHCYCRHQAKLIDENDDCGNPDEVCMQFGMGAAFAIDRGLARKVSKDEARAILKSCEEACLIHITVNRQEIDFLCNCCACHCVFLKEYLKQPRPSSFLSSGFMPVLKSDLCTGCEICLERCPCSALAMGADNVPELNLDRCIGCGACATGCPESAIGLEERPGVPEPPLDRKALKEAVFAAKGTVK